MNLKVCLCPCSLHFHYKRDTYTQLFFSEFWRIFKNNFLLEQSWASASDFISDIFKSNQYMKVSFLLTVFFRKGKIKQKIRVALIEKNMTQGKICFMWANIRHPPDVTFATKNKLTSKNYNLWYLGGLKALGRFPRKHCWWSHFSI